jgi:hypothetical protein
MTCHVHEFDAREGGSIRISLTYGEPTGTGKTTSHSDAYHGRFVKLVPNEKVVEVDEFRNKHSSGLCPDCANVFQHGRIDDPSSKWVD